MYTAASWCMSSWNSTSRWKYSVRSSCGVCCSSARLSASPASRSSRSASALGSGSSQRVVCATRPESNQLSACARRGGVRGTSGSAAAPRARCGLRPSHHSWNQPMCPSSHSGGLSSGEYGTAQRAGRNASS